MNTIVKTDGGHAAVVDKNDLDTCRQELWDAIDSGAGFEEVTDIIGSDLGLEPDYLMDILGL